MTHRPLDVLIVDDELIARRILESHVARCPELRLVGSCQDAVDAFQKIRTSRVDLLLLDINMPEITGMDLLRTLDKRPLVIFTTAYSQFAVESYELNAVDYLLKPITFERFTKAVSKAMAALPLSEPESTPEADGDAVFIKSGGRLVTLKLGGLWLVEGMKDYVRLWTEQGSLSVHSTMKNFEDQLINWKQFVRVHRSYIVNVNFITEVHHHSVKVKDRSVPLGNTYRDQVLETIRRSKRIL